MKKPKIIYILTTIVVIALSYVIYSQVISKKTDTISLNNREILDKLIIEQDNEKYLDKGYFVKFENKEGSNYLIYKNENGIEIKIVTTSNVVYGRNIVGKTGDSWENTRPEYFVRGDAILIRMIEVQPGINQAGIIVNYSKH